jgi:pectate lyase
MQAKSVNLTVLVVLLICQSSICLAKESSDPNDTSKYLNAVRTFADNVLKYGRDTYGPKHTPLFVDGLNIHNHEPVKWISPEGERWILSNLASQQNLFRTLDGLTKITGDPKYRQAAVEAIEYAFENLQVRNGLLSWGVGCVYNLQTDRKYVRSHVLNCEYPYYELMWDVDSNATKQFIEAFWSAHILDWSNLEMNRADVMSERFENPWQHEYKGGPVFFRSKRRNATPFMSAGSDLYYAAALLSKLSGDKEPLVWSKRLAHRYVETRNANTGIGGCIYSLREIDRATAQFGDDFRGHVVNSGTIFPIYPQLDDYVHPARGLTVPQPNRTRFRGFAMQGGAYHGIRPWICQFLLGEILGDDGKEFTRWALEELTAIGRVAYRKKDNSFIPMLTDGTSLEGYVYTKDGYYGPKGTTLKAHWAGSIPFWAYAVGYRLTADEFMWEMARSIAEGNGFGDVGTLAGDGPKLEMEINCSDAYALLGFLELYSKTQNVAFLKMASRIGDNIVAEKFHRGFFVPTKKHLYARFDYPEPLVLLKLEAAARTAPTLTPQVWPSASYFMYNYRGAIQALDVDFIYTLTKSPEPPLTLPAAAGSGDINEVKSLIARGVDVNAWDFGSSYRPLHSAVINGHKQVVELLIAKGADVNAGDGGNIKPLHHAVENGHKEIAELLIAHGADVNATRGYPAGDTPLHSAVKTRHRDIVELLIANGADINAKNNDGQAPVDVALSRNLTEVVELLITKGADVSLDVAARVGVLAKVKGLIEKGTDINEKDVSGKTALHYAVEYGHKDVVEWLIDNGANVNAKDKDGNTPAHIALGKYNRPILELLIAKDANIASIHLSAYQGDLDKVRSFIEKGADINTTDSHGSALLHYAARRGHKALVEFLIARGADVNAKGNRSFTPLHSAAAGGHKDVVALLLDNAANINAKGQWDYTPIYYAAWSEITEVVELLVEKGADVNARDEWDWTPLHYMAQHDYYRDMAEFLMTKGADVNAKDNEGITPLQVAKKKGHSEIVELLKKHGAKE